MSVYTNLKPIIRYVLPPIVLDLIRSLRARMRGGPPRTIEWEYIPDGWAYAATHPEVRGWNVTDILGTYQAKWPRFVSWLEGRGPLGVVHESTLSTNEDLGGHNTIMVVGYALALAAREKPRLTMLDWGGGIGHYYLFARTLLADVPIEYHCQDVPVLAQHGQQLFPDQTFSSDERCLQRSYDFVLASCSLHYTEDWKRILIGLASATNDYLLVTRLPTVINTESFVFIQRPYAHGYGTEYLGWCLNRVSFLEAAGNAGLSCVREFVIDECPAIVGASELCQYRGFLFRIGS